MDYSKEFKENAINEHMIPIYMALGFDDVYSTVTNSAHPRLYKDHTNFECMHNKHIGFPELIKDLISHAEFVESMLSRSNHFIEGERYDLAESFGHQYADAIMKTAFTEDVPNPVEILYNVILDTGDTRLLNEIYPPRHRGSTPKVG